VVPSLETATKDALVGSVLFALQHPMVKEMAKESVKDLLLSRLSAEEVKKIKMREAEEEKARQLLRGGAEEGDDGEEEEEEEDREGGGGRGAAEEDDDDDRGGGGGGGDDADDDAGEADDDWRHGGLEPEISDPEADEGKSEAQPSKAPSGAGEGPSPPSPFVA
jgi:hypothetical protein